MKTILIFLILTVIFGTLFYYLDKQLFYYGRNELDVYNLLPLNVVPEYRYDFEEGFMLWEEDGMSLAGKGVQYWDSDVRINKIITYCFNKHDLIVQVEDSRGNRYYFKYERNDDPQVKQDLSIELLNYSAIEWQNYECININNDEKINTLVQLRSIASLLFVISLTIFGIKCISHFVKKK